MPELPHSSAGICDARQDPRVAGAVSTALRETSSLLRGSLEESLKYGYTCEMNEKLERALQIIRQMPEAEQDRYARLILDYIDQLKNPRKEEEKV